MTGRTRHSATTATAHWLAAAIRRIEADYQRSADTHLIPLPLPALAAAGIDLYLKDESTHPTGSLKHRLARSLFLYALCNGWVREGTTIVEASSGSTAVSEAYFARLLGLPFIAVMPRSTSPEKIAQIAFYGGQLPLRRPRGAGVRRGPRAGRAQPAATTWTSSPMPSARPTGAATTTSPRACSSRWRASAHPVPAWIVVGAGTGGTSATIGRYLRYPLPRHAGVRGRPRGLGVRRLPPHGRRDADRRRLAHRGHRPAARGAELHPHAGRPDDRGAQRSIRWRRCVRSRRCSGARWARRPAPTSSACWRVAQEMRAAGQQGSILSLLCDAGERYLPSYHDAALGARTRSATSRAAQRRIEALAGRRDARRARLSRSRRGLLLAALARGAARPGRCRRAALQFPRDFGSHPDLRTEWWYITGHATTPARRASSASR